MFVNEFEIERMVSQIHECHNVRRGIRLLSALVQSVNEQSDGWASWAAPRKSAEKLIILLKTAGNLSHGTSGSISTQELKDAVTPIRRMVTTQQKKQQQYGNTFDFDVDAALDY